MSTSLARLPQPPNFQVSQNDLSHALYNDMTFNLGSSAGFAGRPRPLNLSPSEGRYKDYKKVRPSQYAHPLQLLSGRVTESINFEGRQVEEHMLRRKTPNGTLAAGYDGNQVEWTKRPHASKHLVMQAGVRKGAENLPRDSKGFRSPGGACHKQQLRQENGVGNGRACWHPSNALSFDSPSHGLIAQPDFEPGSLDHPKRAVPRMDSVLNQSQVLQQPYVVGGFQNVSTALQCEWFSSGGPTASNKQGQYGPYWPDGAFIPYRPAAFRDVRMNITNDPLPRIPLNNSYQSARPLLQRNDQDLQRYGDLNWRALVQPMYSNEPAHAMEHFNSGGHQHPSIDLQGLSLETVQRGSEHLLAKSSPFEASRPLETSSYSHERGSPWQAQSSSNPSIKAHQTAYDSSTHNLQFKERILIEAHRAYLSLLASQHQSRQHANSRIFTNDRLSSHTATQSSTIHSIHSLQARRLNPALPSAQYTTDEIHRPTTSIFRHSESCPTTNAVAALEVLTQLCQESEWQWVDGILLGGCLAYALANYEKALQWYYRVLACDPK